ncbi:MAG: phage tail tube protein [Oscillospiraceae bacterium]
MAFESGARVMSGTHGSLWRNGSELAEVSAFQVKLTKSKTQILMCGRMAEDSKVTGIKYTGSMTLHKVYTRGAADAEAIAQGHDLRDSLVGKLADPDAFGAERISCSGVSYDEQTLMDFAAGKNGETTIPFTCTAVQFLDKVEA